MKLSNVLILLTMTILLAFVVACSGENAHKGVWEWFPEDLVGNDNKFDTGSLRVEVECCKQEDIPMGMKMWAGSGIIENTTEKDLVKIGVRFGFNGKNGLTLPGARLKGIDLLSGQKGRFKFFLNDINYGDIESFEDSATLFYEMVK